jgi:hypothetical protein
MTIVEAKAPKEKVKHFSSVNEAMLAYFHTAPLALQATR